MELNQVRVILNKELVDSFRDLRSTWLMILTPVALALLYFFSAAYGPLAQLEKQREMAQEIAIVTSSHDERLTREWKQLLGKWGLIVKEIIDPERALAERKLTAVLVLPNDFLEKLDRGEPAIVVLKFDALRIDSQIAREKLRAFLQEYEKSVIAQRLADRNVPPDVLEAMAVREENAAPRGGVAWMRVGLMLSFLLLGWSVVSVFSVAVDLTAREKEHGTLEALLIMPTGRLDLVLGKFLAVLVITLCAMASSVLSLWLLVKLLGPTLLPSGFLQDFTHALAPQVLGLAVVVASFAAALMGVLSLALCLWARSSREAYSYSTPIFLGVVFALFFVEFRDMGVSLTALVIPVYNAVLVLRELFQGQLNPTHLGVTLVILVLCTVVGLWLAVRAFNSEKVLFRQ
jgi:sodium transport system permease protein